MKDFTVEEFDLIEEDHLFSSQYQKKKQRLLRTGSIQPRSSRVGIVVLASLILAIGGIYAATSHSDFFQHAFGKGGNREDQPVREETYIMDKEDGNAHEATAVYPSHEYENVDEKTAEDLIGEQVATASGSIMVRDHTFTILSAVRDENMIVLEYTIECPTGVKALTWDEHSDDTHGARTAPDATFMYQLGSAYGKIFVDESRSTDTLLYCTEYDFLLNIGEDGFEFAPYAAGESPKMLFTTYDAEPDRPILDVFADETLIESGDSQLTYAELDTGATEPVAKTIFRSESGGYAEISPLGIRLDAASGNMIQPRDETDEEEPFYPDLIMMTVSLHYKDGSEYLVADVNNNIENYQYAVGYKGVHMISFNRLVDLNEVEYVEVNDWYSGNVTRLYPSTE